jgi:hypothetical protein
MRTDKTTDIPREISKQNSIDFLYYSVTILFAKTSSGTTLNWRIFKISFKNQIIGENAFL